MNESDHTTECVNAGAQRERTLDDMADDYSRRAREARVRQGKTPVITGPRVLNRLAEIMALEDQQSQRSGVPAA